MKILIIMLTIIFIPRFIQAKNLDSLDIYVSSGLSVTNTGGLSFEETSYASTELGFSANELSFALVTGRSNNDFAIKETMNNYWWELKTAITFPMKSVDLYGLLGMGNYFSTNRVFIEYGTGFSYSWDQLSCFAQISNWDSVWYITPGFSFVFSS